MTSPLFREAAVKRQIETNLGEAMPGSSLTTWGFTAFLVGILATVVIFLCSVNYARKEAVTGIISPSQGVVRIIAARTGIITGVHVAEGDVVAAGDILMTVTGEETAAGGIGSDTITLKALADQKSVLDRQIAALAAQTQADRTKLQAQIALAEAEITHLDQQRVFQTGRAKASQEMVDRLGPFKDKGVVSGFEYQNRQQQAMVDAQNLAQLDQQITAKKGDLAVAKLSLARLPIDEADRRSLLQRSLADTETRMAEVMGHRQYEIRAPIAGRVTAVQAVLGRTADPRITQMALVPENSVFQADLFVTPRAIGFVQEGQRVRIHYDAFPYQQFGTYWGTVRHVATTLLTQNDVQQPVTLHDPAYRVTVSLDQQTVTAFGRPVGLQPDMTIGSDIILAERSLIEWILEPLLSARGDLL